VGGEQKQTGTNQEKQERLKQLMTSSKKNTSARKAAKSVRTHNMLLVEY
jgi:hypothetical protein